MCLPIRLSSSGAHILSWHPLIGFSQQLCKVGFIIMPGMQMRKLSCGESYWLESSESSVSREGPISPCPWPIFSLLLHRPHRVTTKTRLGSVFLEMWSSRPGCCLDMPGILSVFRKTHFLVCSALPTLFRRRQLSVMNIFSVFPKGGFHDGICPLLPHAL